MLASRKRLRFASLIGIVPLLSFLALLLFTPVVGAASPPANRPFQSPQHDTSAAATVGFELPIRGTGWVITAAPGTDYDHNVEAISRGMVHAIDLAPKSAVDRHLYAPFEGEVTCYPTSAGKHGLGNVVYINHPNGYQTNLGHLADTEFCKNFTPQKNGIRTGKVAKGGVVGIVGNTGGSLGVHVHWQFQPIAGTWDSLPIYGIPGLRFVSNPRSDGIFTQDGAKNCYNSKNTYVPRPRIMQVCDYYGDAVWEPNGTGPRVQILGGLSLSTTKPIRGQLVTASVKILNTGNRVLNFTVTISARRGKDWSGQNADWEAKVITLKPGQTYDYRAIKSFNISGDYFAETTVNINGWGGINNLQGQFPRVPFTVR